jgi:hypothetical protein
MKKFKIILLALSTILGIGVAIANQPKSETKIKFNIYYALTDGAGGYIWRTYVPFGYFCISGGPYCTLATYPGVVPQDNQIPPRSAIIYSSPYNSIYTQ